MIYQYVPNKPMIIIASVILVLCVIIVILACVLASKSKKNKKPKTMEDTKIVVKKGVRYNDEKDEVSDIKYTQGSIILSQGQTYKAEKKGYVIPGKYYMISGQESIMKFNVRLGGFVREYNHEAEIVLNEGDEITPVSCNIILK